MDCYTEGFEGGDEGMGEDAVWAVADPVCGEADVVGGEDYGDGVGGHC